MGSPLILAPGIGVGFVKAVLAKPVCFVDASVTGQKVKLEIQYWHFEVMSDNHHPSAGYAHRAVDIGSTPAS